MRFPLEVFYELKIATQFDKTAFKDFMVKAIQIQVDVEDPNVKLNETMQDGLKEFIKNTLFYTGLPDELTSIEFLDKLFANLKLTGDEGAFKMYQELNKYNILEEGLKHLQTVPNVVKQLFNEFLDRNEPPSEDFVGSCYF